MFIQAEAGKCADGQVGVFGIDDALILIQVIGYAFQLWQTCSGATNAGEAVRSASVARQGLNYRQARRRVFKACRAYGQDLDTDQLDRLTAYMLQHVAATDPTVLTACCAEPPVKDISDE